MLCMSWIESKAESKRKRTRAKVRGLKLQLGEGCSLPWIPGFLHQIWSRVALAYSSFKQDFSSQPETEVTPCNESTETQPLDHQGPGASDKALAHQLWINEFPREMGSSETSKAFIRRKNCIVHVGWLMGELRESCPHGSLNHFYGAFLPGFLWPIFLLCLDLSPYLLYFRIFPCMCMQLSVIMDFSEEAYK